MTVDTKSGARDRVEVRVWDPFVRFFHWVIAGAFAVAYVSADEMEQVHVVAGYLIGGLIVLRILWGLVGPRHARFTDFIYSPIAVIHYLRDLLLGHAKRTLGHSPAGGAMVIALIIALAVTSVTGIVMGPEEGGYGEAFEELHELAAVATLALVLAHIAGVLLASFVHHENLPLSMFTGRKRPLDERGGGADSPEA